MRKPYDECGAQYVRNLMSENTARMARTGEEAVSGPSPLIAINLRAVQLKLYKYRRTGYALGLFILT